jgi:hypothetical protein
LDSTSIDGVASLLVAAAAADEENEIAVAQQRDAETFLKVPLYDNDAIN